MFAQLMTKQKIIRIPDLLNTFEDIQTDREANTYVFWKKIQYHCKQLHSFISSGTDCASDEFTKFSL